MCQNRGTFPGNLTVRRVPLGYMKSKTSILCCLAVALTTVTSGAAQGPGSAGVSADADVRALMLRVYFHGVDDDLAERVLGRSAIPALRRLLADRDFPRRDNVVAFLAHLDSGEATRDLIAHLENPNVNVDTPEEDRALLLTPYALGKIAARGDRAALDALLTMTEDRGDGGPLARAAARGRDPAALRGDLLEAALKGLAVSRSQKARARLEAISRRSIHPNLPGRDLSRPAAEALAVFGQTGSPGGAAGLSGSSQPESATTPGGGSNLYDTSTTLHDSRLDYANHVKLSSTMTNTRLDSVLLEASARAGREDFSDDLACCVLVSRLGSDATFGSQGDTLDIIDTAAELTSVLNNSIARVKVVRQINYCGGAGTNIIGCAYVGGFGMSLVRMSDLGSEAVLWIHEYGHNTGLNHVADTRNIMYGVDTGANNVLTQSQCNTYHSPVPQAGITPVAIGFCADDDLDSISDVTDNCLNLYNPSQTNTDGDPQGDACDPDDDNDAFLDGSDCAPVDSSAWELPGEATDLSLSAGTGGAMLSWSAPALLGGTLAGVGYDVILSPDAEDFVAGAACLESDGGPDTISASAPPLLPLWSAQGGGINAHLGSAVASGDFNRDARPDLIVGAPDLFNGDGPAGSVVMHPGIVNGVALSWSWRVVSDQEVSKFGASVAAVDVNGDGYDDLLAGAPVYDDGLGGGGAVFVYHGSPSGPAAVPTLILSAGQPGAEFGRSVAAAGDVNGDGYADVIVGAPGYDDAFFNEGKVFVYLGSATGLDSAPVWTATGGQSDAWFGYSVGSAGRVAGGPFSSVIVGAPMYDNGEPNEGRVLVYQGSAAGPGGAASWTFESDQAFAESGRAVSPAGDTNADGYDDVVVGAPLFDNGEMDEGKIWLFSGSPAGLQVTPSFTAEGQQAGAMLGSALASAGDVSGDAIDDLVVGAPGYDNGFANNGRVLLYIGGAGGSAPRPVLQFEADQANSGYGGALAAVGDVNGDGRGELLIGASTYDNTPSDEGWAFLNAGSGVLAPTPDGIFFYLIRPRNACGAGPLAYDSGGVPHAQALSCP